jgi:putative molybdopterin biosynthesis protein
VAIGPVAREYALGFLPVRDERYDFVVPAARRDRPAVRALAGLLASDDTRLSLRAVGFT